MWEMCHDGSIGVEPTREHNDEAGDMGRIYMMNDKWSEGNKMVPPAMVCLLYTSDAADELDG
eukprot:4266081-Ditylum_brightwellii.AAC.1